MYHRCPICLDSMVKPQTIKCGHVFCQDCLSQALRILNVCPICKEPQGVVTGNQPPGQMTWSTLHSSLPGYSGMLYTTLKFQQTRSGVIEKKRTYFNFHLHRKAWHFDFLSKNHQRWAILSFEESVRLANWKINNIIKWNNNFEKFDF